MSANAYPDHTEAFEGNQSEGLHSIAWIDANTGNYILTPQMMAIISGGGVGNGNAPAPQAPAKPDETVYALNIDKFTRIGAKFHAELQERLKRGEKRYPAIKAIAARIKKPASHVELYLKQYIDHLKAEKEQEYRSAILAGMKANKTNKQIAEELGRHDRTIAERRRHIERELLEGAK